MDLNSAIQLAQTGRPVRDDATMREDWTVRWVADEKLLYYFDPKGERKHKLLISDRQRASWQWRAM